MTKLVLDDIGSTLTNTAATTINNNNTKIEQALENTLSRDGSTPNHMNADIDLNSNDLLNVGSVEVDVLVLNGQTVTPSDLSILPPTVMLKTTYDPQGKDGDAFARGNHTGQQPVSSITELDSPQDAVAYVDAVKNFNANGVLDDTANFTSLESKFTGRVVDLAGKEYKVTARPVGNKYVNGFFVIDSVDDGATIIFPANDTLKPMGPAINLMPNERYVAWPQGGPAIYNGELLVKLNSGASHEDTSQYVVTRQSGDAGASFKDYPQRLFQRSDGSREMSMAIDNVDGQWLMTTFVQVVGGAVTELKLYGKRASEYRQWGDDGNPQVRVTTTLGSPNIVIFDTNHGVKPGDRVVLEQASATVGGLALSGTFTVVEGGETNFTVLAGSNATSTDDQNINLNVTFLEDAWAEITFSGVSLGSAIVAASGLGHTMPTQVSGMAGRRNTAGDIFVTIHGGGVSGPCLVGINNIFRTGAPRAIASVSLIGGVTTGNESSLDIDHSTGDLLGVIRTESSVPYRRWYIPFGQTAADAIVIDGPAFPFGAASPIGVRKVPGKDAVYAIMSGNRLPSKVESSPVIGLYLMYMTYTDYKNVGKSFKHIYLQDLHYTDWLILDRNGNGVPGIYVTEEIVGILWSDQYQTGTKAEGGQPSSFLQRFFIGPEALPCPKTTPEVSGWYGGTPVLAYWPPEDITTLSGHFNTDGSLVKRTFSRGLRLTCVTPNASTGVYILSFQDAAGNAVNLGHTNYYMLATTFSGAHYCEVRSQTSTGFEVRTYDAAGAAVNRQFMVNVRIDNEWSDNRD